MIMYKCMKFHKIILRVSEVKDGTRESLRKYSDYTVICTAFDRHKNNSDYNY